MRWFQHGAVYRGFLIQPQREGRGRAARGAGTSGDERITFRSGVGSSCRVSELLTLRSLRSPSRIKTMDCFNSTDPVAVNSTLLYDYYNDEDNLWFRNDTAGPLESCFPPRPRQFQCSVCLHDGTVYAICKKFTDKVRMVMEAVGKSVSISTSDCPTPPASPTDAQQWPQLVIGIIVILLLFLLIIIIGVCLYRKSCKNLVVQTRNDPQEVMVMTTAGANEENHAPPLLSCRADGINNGSQQQLGVQQV